MRTVLGVFGIVSAGKTVLRSKKDIWKMSGFRFAFGSRRARVSEKKPQA